MNTAPTTPRPGIRRISVLTVTFDRIGPVPPARSRKPRPTYGPLIVTVPPHTAKNIDATIAFLTEPLRKFVRMHLPTDAPFTVSIDLSPGGDGTFLVDGGRNGRGQIAGVPQ